MKIINKKEQVNLLEAFIEEFNTLNDINLINKIFLVMGYCVVLGGEISEDNLLSLLKYVDVKINDSYEYETVFNYLSYYVGGEVIKIKDNKRGLAKLINSSSNEKLQKGASRDFSAILEMAEVFRKILKGESNF